jgi:threonine aldolase
MVDHRKYVTGIIDLRSDTVTRPSLGMRRAIAEAEVGDDVLGDDPTAIKLQEMVAEILGKEAALYCSSGTQTNQIALYIQTSPGEEVILEESAHISINEVGAPGLLSGVVIRPVRGSGGVMPIEDVEAVYSEGSLHRRRTVLLCIENTHNMAGGRIYPLDGMEKLYQFARERGVRVHLDGARLFNASVVTGIPVSRYAALADTVSVCLSKGLGAPIGSCLAGTREDIEKALLLRKTLGGGMRQVGIIAAAGIYALENNVERLSEDHENAKLLAEGLCNVSGISIDPDDVETNIVIFEMSGLGMSAQQFTGLLAEKRVLALPVGRFHVRAVTNLNVVRSDIEEAIRKITDIVRTEVPGVKS